MTDDRRRSATCSAPAGRPPHGTHQLVIDHGTVEVFAAGGTATMSALVFPGIDWTVAVDGAATLTVV
jgi:hypothetical protein